MKKRHGGIGALLGMTPGVGFIALSFFNKGFDADMRGTAAFAYSGIALAGAIVGGLLGIISDASRKTPYDSYDFRTLSETEKINVLRKIMCI